MHELYELKEKLCDELKEYGNKEMSTGSLDVVDKLAHTIKNLDKIIEEYDEGNGYSGRYDNRMSRENRNSGRSYARRRDARGRYSRDYSYDEDMVAELKELMEDAPDEKTKMEFKKFIRKIESM